MQRRRFLRATALGALSAGAALHVRAQAYPGPAKVVLPLQAASASDVAVRLMTERLAPRLGTALVVENVAAAAGLVGLEQLSRARPDGRTVAALNNSIVTILPHLQPGKIKGEPRRDYLPVAGIANIPTFFAVPASSPVKTVQDLIKLAKAQPEKLTYSSGGNGSAAHIAFESLKLHTGIFMLHIPYRGTAPSVTDLLAGQVDATFTGAPAVLPHVRSGRLRALAVSSPQRLPMLPDVPTVAESGHPGFEADQWYGVVAPASTPAAVINRLNAEINRALLLPDVGQQLAAEGAFPMPGSPQAFGQLIAREIPRWAAVVKAGQVRAD